MLPRIAFLIPYFGKLPVFFDAFIQSVANKNFDVLFFSDCEQPAKLPSNCQWHVLSLADVRKLAEDNLGLQVALHHPKKLCDFKPALGLIFSGHISSYTFWGSVDLDVCIGNFDKYINEGVLQNIDVFSGIKEYLSGSFFLVRNTAYHNHLFKKSKHWQYVFQQENNLIFDECGGRFFKQLKAGKTFEELKPPVESFTEVLFKEPKQQTRLCFENVIAEPEYGITYIDHNKIEYEGKEYLLVHFVSYKSARTFYTKKRIKLPFYVNRFGFFASNPNFIILLLSQNFWASVTRKLKGNRHQPVLYA